MRRTQGLTIVELLVAMAILGTVLTLAYNTIVTGTRGQRINETTIAMQTKLRRVLDVVSQDIRGSVFGTLSNTPYANTGTSFSVARISGGAGYIALQQGTSTTVTAGTLQFVSDGAPNLDGQTLLLNGEGNGVLFDARGIAKVPAGTNLYRLTMPSCGTLNFTDNLLLYRISTIGYTYEAADRTLYFRSDGAETDQPLAYDIDSFAVSYLYVNQVTGAITETTTPRVSNGVPDKEYLDPVSAQKIVLKQVKLSISTSQVVDRRRVTRSYQTAIDLGYAQSLKVKGIRTC